MQETIGQRLKREREARYLSVEKAAEETRIRKVFIHALEADDYSVIPSAAQGRGFLRNYAEYLGLNIDELVVELQRNPIGPAEEEMSGPLPQLNLVETEIPPLTDAPIEETISPFLGRILRRPKNSEKQPLIDTKDDIVERFTEGEKKVFDEIRTRGQNQFEYTEEADQSLWGRAASLFNIKLQKRDLFPRAEAAENEGQVSGAVEVKSRADSIMAEIGMMLRERRELISLTIDEVERHTHLRAVFVKGLEEGDFSALPSTVQTRGMLSNYASFLDLDVDAVLLRYADVLQARHQEKYASPSRDKVQTQVAASIPVLRAFIAGDLLFGIVMIVAIVGLAIWGVGRVINLQNAEAQPTAPSIVDVLGGDDLPTPSPVSTFVAVDDPALAVGNGNVGDDVPTLEPAAEESTANVAVDIFALERVFVRVSVDGEVAFEGRMAPRESKLFEANDQVVVLTGSGSALRVIYNGQDLGLMGAPGEVVSRVYLISGVATPTATIPPTVTNTPLVTDTPIPSVTPTSTPAGE
ncbi:MAG: DUF4115 domain-containing protein [Anaerolineales bacterium]|nr:DUF4115 domain-containing protein [Anaerolineales bacterium]MCB9145267.1 DUF4115 domain-containing protein [Anaerolineales bacterium]